LSGNHNGRRFCELGGGKQKISSTVWWEGGILKFESVPFFVTIFCLDFSGVLPTLSDIYLSKKTGSSEPGHRQRALPETGMR
jgi:hypothetical protein